MKRVTRFLILTGVSMLAACASQPPASTGNGTPQASAATSTEHPIPDGYQREVVNGSEMYCRDDFETGSRVQRAKVCMTWEQLQALERSRLNVVLGKSPLD